VYTVGEVLFNKSVVKYFFTYSDKKMDEGFNQFYLMKRQTFLIPLGY